MSFGGLMKLVNKGKLKNKKFALFFAIGLTLLIVVSAFMGAITFVYDTLYVVQNKSYFIQPRDLLF